MTDDAQSFSGRYGYERREPAGDIAIHEDAPDELRRAVVELALKAGLFASGLMSLAKDFVDSQREPWEPPVRHVGMVSEADAVMVLEKWDWFWVYDFIEFIYKELKRAEAERKEAKECDDSPPDGRAHAFEDEMNKYFEHARIGWQLIEGRIETRGPEAFQAAVHTAREELEEANRPTASREIDEALQDLSRRPKADLTGAIHHGMGALECVARDVTGDSKATLGEILKKRPDLLPKPLDKALEQVWGYASEKARHLREGSELEREEVELVVSLAASAATYLSQKFR